MPKDNEQLRKNKLPYCILKKGMCREDCVSFDEELDTKCLIWDVVLLLNIVLTQKMEIQDKVTSAMGEEPNAEETPVKEKNYIPLNKSMYGDKI